MGTKIIDDEDDGDLKGKVCVHPEHYPPSHMVIPFGKKMVHECPCCGNVIVVNNPSIIYS